MPTLIVSPQDGSHELASSINAQQWQGKVIYKYYTPSPLALAQVNVGGSTTDLQSGKNEISGSGTSVVLQWQMGSTQTAYIHNDFVGIDAGAPHGADDFGIVNGTFQGLFVIGSSSTATQWAVEVYVEPQDGVQATVNLTNNPDIPQNTWKLFTVDTEMLSFQISMPANSPGGVKVEWAFV